jgi:hypothetical protein
MVRSAKSTLITRVSNIFSLRDLNMRQRRWLEVLKDYDGKVFYHPTKANVVADALSRKSCNDETDPNKLMDQLSQQLAIVQIDKVMTGGPPIMVALIIEPQSLDKIRCVQEDDLKLQDLIDRTRHGEVLCKFIYSQAHESFAI